MFYDYHMHSSFSTDSHTSIEDMVERSIYLGLNEICFTDHVDYGIFSDDSFMVNLDDYFEKLDYVQRKYKDRISIKKGIEFGLQKDLGDYYNKRMEEYDFDFVICSIHAIDRMDLYLSSYFEGRSQHEIYENYYMELYNVVKNYKNYSVLGHLDLIKRYAPFDTYLDDKLFFDIIEATLKQAIHDGKGIELNTSSYRYNLPDLTPSTYILKLYKELGGEIITTGSDSHNTDQVAYKFDYIYSVLKDLGFKYVTRFDKMNPKFIKI
ncbi:histidinol-phosphatase HisJ family protein [Metaclostridioides mangenotii]|uniref:Histidinol-phosphatase n=1 Tax=Metaclostridioides mangenotii TaxID=1540 RepID=A0ABS4EE83_9FIRM|nr:histidinol-phosphatase HisJ family protein [Clostridioides mangenotii]MBP1856255.1 histidinol-phosphatase (PHP family) [Clostridioides mangenotii]